MSNIERSYYDTFGRIVRCLSLPDQQSMDDNAPVGLLYVDGLYSPDDWWIVSGSPVPLPTRPASYFTFNYSIGEWEDQRTAAEYDDYVLKIRSNTSSEKIAFLRSLVTGGAFSNQYIIDLAVGYLPSAIYGALSSLTPEEVLDIQLSWIASPIVGRLDPFITHVATAFGTSDSDLDLLFGIELLPPPPVHSG